MSSFRHLPSWLVRLLAIDLVLIAVTLLGEAPATGRYVALVLFNLWFGVELYLERLSGSSSASEEDRGSRHLLTAVRDICIIAPVGISAVFVPAGSLLLSLLGGLAYGVGLTLRLAAMASLGQRFTMALTQQPQHTLITSGPYQRMRHPGYLGLVLIFGSFSLICGTVVTGLALSLLTIAALHYRIQLEERLLVNTFGVAYLDYRARTWAFWPKFARSKRRAA